MKKTIQALLLPFLLLAAVMHAMAGPGTGAGSVTADNGYLASAGSDVSYIYSETLHLGPSARWQIGGTIYFYGKNIRIAPGAVLSGTGKIVLMDPSDNPLWEDMPSGQTTIDGNNGGFIDVNIEHRNPGGALLANLADAGYNSDGSNNTLKIGKDLLLGVDGANITLSSATVSDLVFDSDATISGYRPSRMVITGNISSHVVKQNYTGGFTFPVGIASGDYTPARLTNTSANTLHVSVLDYQSSTPSEGGADGVQRTWNIYADNAGGNTQISLQHNSSTEQSGFNTGSHFVTRYGAAAPNTSGDVSSASAWQSNSPASPVKSPATAALTTDASGMSGFSISSRNYTTFSTIAAAEIAYFSKSSDVSNPLGAPITAAPTVTGNNPTAAGTATGSADLVASSGSYPANTPVTVTYLNASGTTLTYTGSTDATGKITIPGLAAGTYRDFKVSVSGGTASAAAGFITLSDPGVVPAAPAVTGNNPTTAGTATGSADLQGSTGPYPFNTAVVVTYTKPDGTTTSYTGSTDATGKIRVPGLPAGIYKDFKVSINGGPVSAAAGMITLADPGAVADMLASIT